jgi:glycosidase
MSHPLLYEVNARCWLRALSQKSGTAVTLANVPDSEIAGWQKLGFTHIWLMGVWTTGPRSRAEALKSPELRRAYDEVLPGWTEADVAGSPYAIGDYQVPPALGGEAGLKEFREKLRRQGLKLVLDFVPNHVGLDHPWVRQRPEFFVQSLAPAPGAFAQETGAEVRWLAHGKDPYFAPWTDTVQLDYRCAATRAAMTQLLQSIARRCDGVRCDMAMLVLSDVFAKTW